MKSMFCSVIAAATLALTVSAQAETRSVVIATGDYEPFVSQNAEDGGFVNGVIAKAFDRAGYETNFDFMPWRRALELTRRGDFTASSYWYFSAERDQEFIHAGPLFEERLVFFALDSSADTTWTELSDLEGMTIGVVDGYTYTKELWELGEQGVLTLERAPSDEANFRKLLAGRIDLLPVSEVTGGHLLETVFSADDRARIVIIDRPLSTTHGYLLISRSIENAEQIASDFNAALNELRASGEVPAMSESTQTE